ncbi:MAG TPA: DNA-formamidopyrimidine glycosylase family protein [Thermoleophilaceae bacterium]|nr:DNA-formamidopyrimidine glycosylase family protein [Thermoleophilaceae bacterium]
MPELPDVEGFRRVLAEGVGRRIASVETLDRTLLRNTTPQGLGRALKGKRFRKPRRHGKWLVARADGACVLMHFGMTGLLEWSRDGGERHRHDRIVFVCEHGELRYRNMRKFGGVWLARDQREYREATGPLGPDAQSLSRDDFERLLRGRRGEVKAALMDQRLIAGVGNLLSDEVLWRARVNPRARASSLNRRRRDALWRALRCTLRESIPAGRVPHGPRWLTRVRDQREPACPRCGNRLRKGTVAGRTACWCPRCQRT